MHEFEIQIRLINFWSFRCRIFQPLCLGGLVSYFAQGQTTISKEEAYCYAAGIVLCSLLPVIIFHHYILYIFQIGMKVRVACCSLLYKKVKVAFENYGRNMMSRYHLWIIKFNSCGKHPDMII